MNETTRFVTFYSYKGGVGRTSALVNAAVIRALHGNNVVILDFDLEAPGTSPYLKKLNPRYNEHREGLLEYLVAAIDGPTVPSLAEKATDLSEYLEGENGGHLWAISAGNTADPNYTAKLEKLKWNEIFEKKSGELLLRNFRNQIVQEFGKPDYVFIDSRTGITETGGVCTRYLGDVLAILTSLNEQNINGTAMIYKEFVKEQKDTILVAANVPIGMPYAEDQLFCQRIGTFKEKFSRPPDVIVYYYPVLALSEVLPALLARSSTKDKQYGGPLFATDPLLQSYERLAREIDKDRPGQMSYLPLLKRVAIDLSRYFYTKDVPERFNVLKQYYSDRLLAKIILDTFDFAKSSLENANSPESWNKTAYKKLVDVANTITNSSVKQVIDNLQHFVFRSLNDYLRSTGRMEENLEAFLDSVHLELLVLEEISRKRYDWPKDYLQRSIAKIPPDDHLEKAWHLYNMGYCLLQSGQKAEAHGCLEGFLEEFQVLNFTKYSAVDNASYYFCAALVSKELGLKDQADRMRLRCEEQLSILKPGTEVFSPLNYTRVTKEELSERLESAFN